MHAIPNPSFLVTNLGFSSTRGCLIALTQHVNFVAQMDISHPASSPMVSAFHHVPEVVIEENLVSVALDKETSINVSTEEQAEEPSVWLLGLTD
jgi:hypothetical protein